MYNRAESRRQSLNELIGILDDSIDSKWVKIKHEFNRQTGTNVLFQHTNPCIRSDLPLFVLFRVSNPADLSTFPVYCKCSCWSRKTFEFWNHGYSHIGDPRCMVSWTKILSFCNLIKRKRVSHRALSTLVVFVLFLAGYSGTISFRRFYLKRRASLEEAVLVSYFIQKKAEKKLYFNYNPYVAVCSWNNAWIWFPK